MLLRQLFEAIDRTGEGNTAVVGWGRGMGHKGHMMLASSVITHAEELGGDPYFVVSRTYGPDDPLQPEEKLAIYRKVFPEKGHIFQTATDELPDLTRVLSNLNQQGYTDAVVVVGADQKTAFQYLNAYNGKPNKKGEIPFSFDSLDVISRQETNDPSREEEGPRATPMRAVLTDPSKSEEEQFAVWRDAMPDNLSDDEVMDLMNKAKQRMAAVPAAKNAKKAKKAVAEGSLNEGPSLPSTLKSIATNGEPITQLYGKLQAMAKRWVDNNGSLKGFHRNAAGQSAQWFNNFYFNKLQADLYALAKQAPRHAAPLIVFLKDASEDRESRINFTEISRSLPPILFRMGKKIDDESLARFAASWDSRRKEYESYLSDLEDQADGEDDFDEPVVKPEKSKMPGQQNAQAEQIVNDILSKLPKNVAGDIRNAIARAPNKLQALHQELSKRKIQGVAEGKITLSTDPNWYGATVDNYQATGPVVNIPANQLVGFEPDDKMNQPKSKVNVEKIVAGLKQGAKLPPLLVRKYKNGYQVLDGHHRFWAYKLLGVKSIPAQIVPDSDIEEISKQGVAEGWKRDYRIKAQLSQAMAQANRFFDRDDPAKVAAADQTIAKREKGLARADARVKPYTPPAQDAEKMQRDLTAKYPNIDELVAAAEQRRDPNYDYAEGNAYYDGREAEQNYQKLKQIQRVIQGLNESLNRSHLP